MASPATPGKFDISVNGIIVKTDESFPITGGWQIYSDKMVKGVLLPKGQVYLKIIFKTKDFNFNYIDVTADSDLGIDAVNSNSTSNIIFPNPFTNETSFKITTAMNEKIVLKIIDMKGIICYSSEAFSTNEEVKIGATLLKGIYIVSLKYGTLHQNFKIIKN
jgi:hypothetical protein